MDQRTNLWSPKRPDLTRSNERSANRLTARSRLVEGTSSRFGTRSTSQSSSSRHQEPNLSRGLGIEVFEEDAEDPQWKSSASMRGFVKDFTSEVSPRYMQASPPRRRSFSNFLEETSPREGRSRGQPQHHVSSKLSDRSAAPHVRTISVLNHELSGPPSRLERFLSRNELFLESPLRQPVTSGGVRRSAKDPTTTLDGSRFRSSGGGNDLVISPERNTRIVDSSRRRMNEQQQQQQLSPPRRRVHEEGNDVFNNNYSNEVISPQQPFDATDEIWSSRMMMFSSASGGDALTRSSRRGPTIGEEGQGRVRTSSHSTLKQPSNVLAWEAEEEDVVNGPKPHGVTTTTASVRPSNHLLGRHGVEDGVVDQTLPTKSKVDEPSKQPVSTKQTSHRPSLDEVPSAVPRTSTSKVSPQRGAQAHQGDSPERERRRQLLLWSQQQQQQQEKGREEAVTRPTDFKAYPKDLSPIRDPAAFSSPTNSQGASARVIGKTPSPGRPSSADRKLDFSGEPASSAASGNSLQQQRQQQPLTSSLGEYKAVRPSQMLQQHQQQSSSLTKRLDGVTDSIASQRPSNLVTATTQEAAIEQRNDDKLDKQKMVQTLNRFEQLNEARSPLRDAKTHLSASVTRLGSAAKETNAADVTATTRIPAQHLHFDDSKHGEDDLDLPLEGKEVAAFSYNIYNAEAFKEPARNEEVRISNNGQSPSRKIHEEKQRDGDLVTESPSLNHGGVRVGNTRSSPVGSLPTRKGAEEEIVASQETLPQQSKTDEQTALLLLATPQAIRIDHARTTTAVAFSEPRLSTAASMMTHPNEEDAKRWAKVADLLDMSGFDGTEFRKITKSRGGALGAVDRALQTVLRDFQRQKKLIEKSMEATKREDQERLQFEKALAMKNDLMADLEARNQTLQQTIARMTEEEKSRRAAAAATATATSASAISDAQRQKRWENRARKMEEEFLRVRDQLESELQLGMETRRKAREEFERLLGRKSNPADARIVQILEGFVQDQLRGLKTQVLPPQSARSSQQASAEKDALETALVTARSRDEIRDFAKRVCELVLAHSPQEDMVENADEWGVFSQIQNEDLVDEKGWFPTRVVSKVIPQISRWISQAEEVDRLRFWRDQILAQTNTASEEAALRVLRRKVNE